MMIREMDDLAAQRKAQQITMAQYLDLVQAVKDKYKVLCADHS